MTAHVANTEKTSDVSTKLDRISLELRKMRETSVSSSSPVYEKTDGLVMVHIQSKEERG